MLKFESVSFRYSADSPLVLKEISIDISTGERVAVMGGNGSGKTTLALLAARLLRPVSGAVGSKNEDCRPGVVFQNPDNQIISVTVERELAFPLECRQIQSSEIIQRVDEMLAWADFEDRRFDSPNNLSGGEKQKLALAAALIARPDLLILDEPTSHLDAVGSRIMWDAIGKAQAANPSLTVLIVTQSSSEALGCGRVIVLDQGEIVADRMPRELFCDMATCRERNIKPPEELLAESVIASAFTVTDLMPTPHDSVHTTDVIEISGLSYRWPDGVGVFDGLDLTLRCGRVTGLAAPSGEGKTTLGLLLAGLIEQDCGEIALNGTNIDAGGRLRNFCYLFQFPERQIFSATVFDEVAFGLERMGVVSHEIEERVIISLETAGLQFANYAHRSPFDLSGGEIRKVSLASNLALDRDVMIYDEPNVELDLLSAESFERMVRSLDDAGRTQLIISHDTEFLFDICDDLVLMHAGRVRFVGDKFDTLDDPGVFSECSVDIPQIVRLCEDEQILKLVRRQGVGSVRELMRVLKQTP